ncbi:MAG: alkaline phosphatase family protein [bacterium]
MEMAPERAILFVIDGLKREIFYNLLSDGKLPGFGEIFKDGVWVRYGTTVFPSETLPSQASLFTGCQVRRHKIVGNAWLDREKDPVEIRDYNRPATAAQVFGYHLFGLPTGILPLRNPAGLVNQDLSAEVPTIYEAGGEAGLDSVVIFNHFSRGCTRWVRPGRAAVTYFAATFKANMGFRHLDAYTARVALGYIRKSPLPRLMTIYLCGLDNWGHHTGDRGQVFYIKRILDPIVEKIVRELDHRGALDSTFFTLTSDHGQAWVGASARMINVDTLAKVLAERGYNAAKSEAEFAADTDCFLSIIGGCAFVYVRHRETKKWSDPPEIEHIAPAAECVSSICTKAYPEKGLCPEGCSALILVRGPGGGDYMVYQNGTLLPLEKYFWEKLEKYPQAFNNIYGLNCARSGDLVVFSNFEEGCYFSDRQWPRGHGSIAIEDTSIPILFAGPGLRRRVIERAAITDVAPTILGQFGAAEPRMDGRTLKLNQDQK